MGKNYCRQKLALTLVSVLGCCIFASAQTLVLRPAMGKRFFYAKQSTGAGNNFDPYFDGNYDYQQTAATISAELLHKKHSYELTFTSQHGGYHLYYYYSIAGSHEYISGTALSQFQLCYNKFFDISNPRLKFVRPFIGLGAGIAFNTSTESYDDTYYTVKRQYSLIDPAEYIDMDARRVPTYNTIYSAVIKAGLAFKRKGVERLRVQAVCNIGLRRIYDATIKYSYGNDVNRRYYYGKQTTYGNMLSVLVSMPIYIKRWQK